ncbi:dihydrofolate reductase family protein [Leptospira meyeri]|uniref:dihydrofolate reductase family protein n=1 Tax=Leptospira meyeri TaxID=29508 RepID=UPI0030B82A21
MVFSRTLKALDLKSAKLLANQDLEKEVLVLKNQPGKDIFVCSPSLFVSLTKVNLIEEYQLCVNPLIAGSGLPLFKVIRQHILLNLIKIKLFRSGTVLLYYHPNKKYYVTLFSLANKILDSLLIFNSTVT